MDLSPAEVKVMTQSLIPEELLPVAFNVYDDALDDSVEKLINALSDAGFQLLKAACSAAVSGKSVVGYDSIR